MTTGLEHRSATIHPFPVGGRAGLARRGSSIAHRTGVFDAKAPKQFDWAATYHADAVAEEAAGPRRTTPKS